MSNLHLHFFIRVLTSLQALVSFHWTRPQPVELTPERYFCFVKKVPSKKVPDTI